MKALILLTGAALLSACTTIPHSPKHVQILKSNSALINGCEKLGPILTETRGGPFNFDGVAEGEFKKQAAEKYNADTVVITAKEALPFGKVRLEGTALKCYK